jgi:hypothetical protein
MECSSIIKSHFTNQEKKPHLIASERTSSGSAAREISTLRSPKVIASAVDTTSNQIKDIHYAFMFIIDSHTDFRHPKMWATSGPHTLESTLAD